MQLGQASERTAGWESVRATGHKTPGESSVILQIVVRVQLTSRRILRD